MEAHGILRASRFAYAALEAAAWATRDAKTLKGRSRHCRRVVRVSTLLTCWHGQETTVAPPSNVAYPSTISVARIRVVLNYRIEATRNRGTLSRLASGQEN